MEEKKNNAIEKVENIINGSSPSLDAQKRAEEFKHKRDKAKIKAEKRIEKARIKGEKQAEKEREKLAKRRYKTRVKAERKARRLEDKEIKKQNGENQNLKIAVISLSISTLVLASVLAFTFMFPSKTETGLENAYRRAFYGAVEQVDSIDANLSKAIATKDENTMSLYLVDTSINSELCENDLGELPLQDENKFYTTKLVNQIGDFSKYLNKKILNGEGISQADRQTLKSLYLANKQLRDALQQMMQEMDTDFSFIKMMDKNTKNVVLDKFNELQNLSTEYPELIYDGPFSDGQTNREIKGLSGDTISKRDAENIFKQIFASRGVENIKCTGEVTGQIECFAVEGEVKGDTVYAQISKTGGKLLMFEFAGSCKDVKYDQDYAILQGKTFLKDLGIDGMEAVWVNLANNVYTINFAFTKEDVTVYADLIKVRVCAQTGGVIGIEATSYYTNHKERQIDSPKIDVKQAKNKVLDGIDIVTTRLALVPVGTKLEKLCYEFSGEMDGETYYVYIDAVSGRQVEMFKVIESTEGTLLI